MGTTGREWRHAFVAHGVSGRVDHGDRIERRVRFEHICVVFGVFAGGKLFVAILWSSCARISSEKEVCVLGGVGYPRLDLSLGRPSAG